MTFWKVIGLGAPLLLVAGTAFAQSRLDPMRQLRTDAHAVTEARLDPMQALRAPPRVETDEITMSEDFGGLPDAPGVEKTYYACVACHSTEIIKQQRVTDARWDDLWRWMVDSQGMFEPDPEEKDIILGYLKTHFSSER